MKVYRGRGSIAPLILDLDTRLRRVVSLTPWVLYLQESPGTHCIAGRVGLGTNLDSQDSFALGTIRIQNPTKGTVVTISHYNDYKLHMEDIITVCWQKNFDSLTNCYM